MKFRTVALIAGLTLAGYSTVTLINSNLTSAKAQVVPTKIVNDQVAEYNVAVKAGSRADRCVQAGFVASAYNQTRDEVQLPGSGSTFATRSALAAGLLSVARHKTAISLGNTAGPNQGLFSFRAACRARSIETQITHELKCLYFS